MRLCAAVTSVRSTGDDLEIEVRGWESTAPGGTRGKTMLIVVRDTAANRRAYYVGRDLYIDIEPRRGPR